MAIPKVIHYVWVGSAPIPEQDLAYMKTWQEKNPDFEIRRWSEKDIDLKKYPLVKKAIDEKRWALAADIIRMYVIYNEGGFYLDTDVELLKSLEPLTKYDGVAGWESNFWFTTAAFGAKKHSPWIGKILSRYEGEKAIERITTNTFLKTVHSPSTFAKDFWPLECDGKTHVYGDDEFIVLAREIFCPKHYMTGKDGRTKDTIAYHHYASTWHTPIEGIKNAFGRFGYRLFDPKIYAHFEKSFNHRLEKKIRKEV